MGSESMSLGKQTRVAAWDAEREPDPMMSPVVGKTTLVSHLLAQAPSDFGEFLEQATRRELASVVEHAGKRFLDGGKFEFECKSDGSFELTRKPTEHGPKVGTVFSLDKDPVVWHAVRTEMLKKLAPAQPSPPPAKKSAPHAPLPAPDDTHPHLDTLAVALQKITDDGQASNYYRPAGLEHATEVDAMVSGSASAKEFWCSGFSMWTLANAGYAMTDCLRDDKKHAFTYTLINKDASRAEKERAKLAPERLEGLADDEWPTTSILSMRAMVDGHPTALRALKVFLTTRPKTACNLGTFRAEGAYDEALRADGDAIAARGAVSAFEAFGIGGEIDAADRKPGDFAQEFWSVNGTYTGKGHAFQVASIKARGAARFGEAGSPVLEGGTDATGWRTDVVFTIDLTTRPALVGAHQVISERRAEANEKGVLSAEADQGHDGGIHVTGDVTTQDRQKVKPGLRTFYGRLGASPWANWKPASG